MQKTGCWEEISIGWGGGSRIVCTAETRMLRIVLHAIGTCSDGYCNKLVEHQGIA